MRTIWMSAVMAASMAVASQPAASASAMTTGGLTSQPIGHYEFCRTYRTECRQDRDGSHAPVTLTQARWNDILDVNSAVNIVIEPRSDMDIYGREEVWTFPDVAGDCEDYVLLKRQMLMDRGFPAGSLLITVVRKPDGEAHAVLTVRTDRGDYVMDNLRSGVRLWIDTEYTFLKRQSKRHAGHWVSIQMPDPVIVGSVR